MLGHHDGVRILTSLKRSIGLDLDSQKAGRIVERRTEVLRRQLTDRQVDRGRELQSSLVVPRARGESSGRKLGNVSDREVQNRMGGGEPSSSSMETAGDMPTGTETELLRIGGAQLYLLDGQESVRMGQGYFTVIMMVQAQSPLAAVVAQVADVQWPVGKDGPVLKLANYRYTFAIPGLLYGVVFPRDTPKELIQTFESLMLQFCTYEVRPDIAEVAELSNLRLRYPPTPDDVAMDGAQYWSAIADDVEQYSSMLAQQIKQGSSMAAAGLSKGGRWAAARARSKLNLRAAKGGGDGGGVAEEMSPRMRSRVDQARRMSAVAKLVSRTVLKGAISATGHVANLLGSAVSQPVRAYLNSDARREVAVASVDAFAKVAEAVETAGKSLATATISAGTDLVQQRYGEQASEVAQEGLVAVGDMISSMWTLNKIGLRMLWGATASSIFLNANPANASAARHAVGTRASSSSPDNSMRSVTNSPTFSGVSTSSTPRPSRPVTRTRSLSSQSQLRQLLDDTGGTPQRPSSSAVVAASRKAQNERDPVLETVQLFPSTSASDRDRDSSSRGFTSDDKVMNTYMSTTPTGFPHHQLYMPHQMQHPPPLNMLPPAYAGAYYHPIALTPSGPFQHYSRPDGPPQTQAFFPYPTGIDPSVTR